MANLQFDTKPKRKRLVPRREPYWQKIGKGRFIGFRKTPSGGSWIARLGKRQESLEDEAVWDHKEATKAVNDWCDIAELGGPRKFTVQNAIDKYVEALAERKTPKIAKETASRLAYHMPDHLRKIQTANLTSDDIEIWRNSMVKRGDAETVRRSKDSANRVLTMLKAALNNSYRKKLIASDHAWRTVPRFEKVGKARELFLSDEEVKRLLEVTSGPFHNLLKAGMLCGARYGELCNATAGDLDTNLGILKLDGKTGKRDCFLSAKAIVFFKDMVKGKLPRAPLLSNEDGEHWKADQQRPRMKAAVQAGGLPTETIFYSLRHYYISKSVAAGIQTLAIARNVGTSVEMIEETYGKFRPENMRQLMDLVQLPV